MNKPKYKLDSRYGDVYYILQIDKIGTYQALFKGYPNYKNNTFTLYPNKLYIKGIEGYHKKIIKFNDVK